MTDLALPNPSAMGFLKGKLVDFDETSRGILELESGARIPCSVTGQIKAKIAKLRDRALIWTVYPTASKNGLALKIRSRGLSYNGTKSSAKPESLA